MSSRTKASLAGIAIGLPGNPVFAEESRTLELDAISVTSDYESPTGPVDGYRATRSSSATKTDTAKRGYPSTPDVANIERIEVLKDPAASLYGQGDPGGTVNIVSNKPQADTFATLQTSAGNWDRYRTALGVNTPLDDKGNVLSQGNLAVEDSHSVRDHARLQPLKPPAVLAVALDNGMWSQTADKKWINEGRSKVPGAIESTQTFKYSLAIYQPGAKLPKLDQLKLLILPEVDPLTVGPGNSLPVRVLLDGKPAAGVKLVGDYRNAPNTLSTETDADCQAQVLVRNEGLNVIAAQVEVPVKDSVDVSSRGLFSSLTFLGEAHHE